MKKTIVTFLLLVLFAGLAYTQTQPIEIPSGYRFQHRIKGPSYKKSKVLELAIDEHGNYLVATFRGEKSSFVYLIVYNLYTWDEKYKIKLDDNRCELYNSAFDEEGETLFVNYDIYRNLFKKIDLASGKIEKVDCSETPKGCEKIEPEIYKVDGYTVGKNYYIFRDDKFKNYIRVYAKKEIYIPKGDEEENMLFQTLKPGGGGTILFTPDDIKNLRAGVEIEKSGIPIFFDPNAVDEKGYTIPYEVPEGQPYKLRFSENEMGKLEGKVSFKYESFIMKIDLEAFSQE